MPVNFIDVNISLRDSKHSEAYEQQARELKAIINGSSVMFITVEDKFNALVAEWRRLRERGSSTDKLINDAYGQIVAMGWSAVPLLLREVENESGHWFTALKWITGANIVTPDMRGNIPAIREAWLKWGRECESQTKQQRASGSEITFQGFPSATAIGPVGRRGTTTALDLPSGTIAGGTQTTNTTIITGPTTPPAAPGLAPMLRR